MSFLSKIFKKAGSFIKKNIGTIASIALPGIGGMVAGQFIGSASAGGSGASALMPSAPKSTEIMNIPVPGIGGAAQRILPGGATGYYSRGTTKLGKMSGNPIPRGFYEFMTPEGIIILRKQYRRRGITARDMATTKRVLRHMSGLRKQVKTAAR